MSNDRYGPWKVAVKDISTQRGQVAVDFKQRYQPKLVREALPRRAGRPMSNDQAEAAADCFRFLRRRAPPPRMWGSLFGELF